MSSVEKALMQEEEDSVIDKDITIEKDTKYSWFVCACAFFSQVFVLGVLHAYGVFFVEIIKDFETTKSEAAWIGSLAYGLSMTFGPVTSMLITKFGYKRVMMVGGLICASSLLVSSFSTSVLMLFLTFSVTYGVGTCMITSPTMTMSSEYFERYLSVATGITVAGSSFGTLIMGPLSQFIIDKSSWRVAFRVYAGLCIVTVVLNSQIRPLAGPSRRRVESRSFIHDLHIWKNRVFVVWTMSIALVMFGFYIPYVHLVSYAIDQGISPDRASMFMLVLGATTAIGRILFGKIVQWGFLNRLHMHQLSMVVTGTGVMLLPLITSFGGILVYVLVVGMVDGCFVVLLPIMCTSLMGVENSVLAWGFMIGTASITFTIGPPVAGALYDMTGSYNVPFHCAGVPILTGAALLFLIPWAQRTSSTSNVLEIFTEYTINDPPTQSRVVGGRGPYECDSEAARTTRSEEMGPGPIDIDKSQGSVRTTQTLRIQSETHLEDKSVGTGDFPFRYFPMDIEDALSQLSVNDKLFDDMLRQSYESRQSCSKPVSDASVEIPRIPPPRDSLRYRTASENSSIIDSVQDKSSLHSYCRPSLTSATSSFLQPSMTSDHSKSIHSASRDIFPPPVSQLFSSTSEHLDPLGCVQSCIAAPSKQTSPRQLPASASISTADSETDPDKKSNDFDQAIYQQVSLIKDALSFTQATTDEEEMTTNTSRLLEVSTAVSGSNPEIKILAPTPDIGYRFAASDQPSIPGGGMPQEPVAGPSNVQSVPAFTETLWEQEPHAMSASGFECGNQITVIPGTNPFISVNKRGESSEPHSTKLEDLFKRVKKDDDEVSVVSAESQEVVAAATKSQTGELDVFTHLFFDDEETR